LVPNSSEDIREPSREMDAARLDANDDDL